MVRRNKCNFPLCNVILRGIRFTSCHPPGYRRAPCKKNCPGECGCVCCYGRVANGGVMHICNCCGVEYQVNKLCDRLCVDHRLCLKCHTEEVARGEPHYGGIDHFGLESVQTHSVKEERLQWRVAMLHGQYLVNEKRRLYADQLKVLRAASRKVVQSGYVKAHKDLMVRLRGQRQWENVQRGGFHR